MISTEVDELEKRVQQWLSSLLNQPQLGEIPMQVVDTHSTVGGGSLPGQTLPTKALAISVNSADALAERLRFGPQMPPVIGRIEKDQFLLDPRTVLPEQDQTLIDAVSHGISGH